MGNGGELLHHNSVDNGYSQNGLKLVGSKAFRFFLSCSFQLHLVFVLLFRYFHKSKSLMTALYTQNIFPLCLERIDIFLWYNPNLEIRPRPEVDTDFAMWVSPSEL